MWKGEEKAVGDSETQVWFVETIASWLLLLIVGGGDCSVTYGGVVLLVRRVFGGWVRFGLWVSFLLFTHRGGFATPPPRAPPHAPHAHLPVRPNAACLPLLEGE